MQERQGGGAREIVKDIKKKVKLSNLKQYHLSAQSSSARTQKHKGYWGCCCLLCELFETIVSEVDPHTTTDYSHCGSNINSVCVWQLSYRQRGVRNPEVMAAAESVCVWQIDEWQLQSNVTKGFPRVCIIVMSGPSMCCWLHQSHSDWCCLLHKLSSSSIRPDRNITSEGHIPSDRDNTKFNLDHYLKSLPATKNSPDVSDNNKHFWIQRHLHVFLCSWLITFIKMF